MSSRETTRDGFPAELMTEAARQFGICNACRYCEGYCAAFPAMERRTKFAAGDVVYLANLCHDCRSCYQACMYAPPHEFDVVIPELMAAVRSETYRRYAWPRFAASLFRRNALWLCLAGAISLLVLAGLTWARSGSQVLLSRHVGPGSFYEVVPFAAILIVGLAVTAFVLWALSYGFVAFWRDIGGRSSHLLGGAAWRASVSSALSARQMSCGGSGCHYPDPWRSSSLRRILHVVVVSGFIAALGSTTVAFVLEHMVGVMSPFPIVSAPVILGTAGGLCMVVGASGLLALKLGSAGVLTNQQMFSMDIVFLVALWLVNITGFLVLVCRSTSAMPALLILHLASVVALAASAPYGKFVHAVYRWASIFRDEVEKAQEAFPVGGAAESAKPSVGGG